MFGLKSGSFWESIVFAIVVLAFATVVSRVFKFLIGRGVKAAALKLKVDHTRYRFILNATDFLIYLIAFVVIFKSIPALNAYGNTLLTGAGVLAAIVGFASQSAFSNIISGIFLVIFRPFSVGDRVQIGQLYTGNVEDITLRHTVIRNFENRLIVIPNSVINNETIINSTLSNELVCIFVEFTIAFSSDVDKAIQIIHDQAVQHPECRDHRTEEDKMKGVPQVIVRLVNLTEFGQHLRSYVWAKDPPTAFVVKTDLLKAVKKEFDRQGIVIPYRTIYTQAFPAQPYDQTT